ncbi:MAG: hypothetical protein Nk1A_7030 [Endomicrobiia bacterium]|nr:MAG: hypothetical protein Nk1A_7030 [Endomicrobiia bacterium]
MRKSLAVLMAVLFLGLGSVFGADAFNATSHYPQGRSTSCNDEARRIYEKGLANLNKQNLSQEEYNKRFAKLVAEYQRNQRACDTEAFISQLNREIRRNAR